MSRWSLFKCVAAPSWTWSEATCAEMSPLPKLITREAGAAAPLCSSLTSVSAMMCCASTYPPPWYVYMIICMFYITHMYEGNIQLYMYIYTSTCSKLTDHPRLLAISHLANCSWKAFTIAAKGLQKLGVWMILKAHGRWSSSPIQLGIVYRSSPSQCRYHYLCLRPSRMSGPGHQWRPWLMRTALDLTVLRRWLHLALLGSCHSSHRCSPHWTKSSAPRATEDLDAWFVIGSTANCPHAAAGLIVVRE